jgi:hypothetical protein
LLFDEEAVYITAREILVASNWQIIGGQPPGGCDDLPIIEIKSPLNLAKGSGGALRPDLVAYKGGVWCLVEAKPRHSYRDADKLLSIVQDPILIEALAKAIEGRHLRAIDMNRPDLRNVIGCLANADSRTPSAPLRHIDVRIDRVFA